MTPEKLRTDGFYYLASPYSHSDPAIRDERVEEARMHQAYLFQCGIIVYPAVGATHEMAIHHALPTDDTYWQRQNYTFLRESQGMIICTIKGWLDSRGVMDEISICRAYGRRMWLFNYYRVEGPDLQPYA